MHKLIFRICNPDKPGSSVISNPEVPVFQTRKFRFQPVFAMARACAHVAHSDGGHGARRCGEAGLEMGRGRAHGMSQAAASVTGGGTSGEEQRRGGAMTNGGGRRRLSPAGLHGQREGRMRRGTGRGEGGDALQERNRAAAHRRRRITAGSEAPGGGNGGLGFGGKGPVGP